MIRGQIPRGPGLEAGFSSPALLAYVLALKEDYPEANRWLEEFISRAPDGLG